MANGKHRGSVLVGSFMFFAATAQAEEIPAVCHWNVQTTDGRTREVRSFEPGNKPFDLPITSLPGWKYCRVSEVKKLMVKGADGVTRPATRLDIWCVTDAGAAINYSDVVTTWSPFSTQYFQLLGKPVSFARMESSDTIDASGYLEITFSCIP